MCSTALCLQSSGSNEGENMDAPLQDCTIEEQIGIVRFLWAEGVKQVRQVADTCECGNEPSGSVKCGEFLD